MVQSFFFSRQDPEDIRWGDLAAFVEKDNLLNLKSPGLLLIGFPDDKGIVTNGGRSGAAMAPDKIRSFLYKCTPSPGAIPFSIGDLGNISIYSSLEKTHAEAYAVAEAIWKFSIDAQSSLYQFPVFLGGGHDFAYPVIRPLLDFIPDLRLVNMDAHLDVRPFRKEAHSGTPFYRLISEAPQLGSRFLEWGVQRLSCSNHHLQWAQNQGVKVLFSHEDESLNNLNSWIQKQKLGSKTEKPFCFLSLDIDVFASYLAPGCSAPAALGVCLNDFNRAFYRLSESFHIIGMGVFEVSPPLDVQDQTSRFASHLIHSIFTELWSQKHRQLKL